MEHNSYATYLSCGMREMGDVGVDMRILRKLLAEEAKMDCSYGKTGRPRCKMGLNGKALCVGLSALGSLFRALT